MTSRTEPPEPRGRSVPSRRDGQRSRALLLAAAAELLAAERPFSLPEVAAHAGVSTATAYRHFASAENITQAFVAGFLDDVEARVTATPPEPDPERRLLALNRTWAATVVDWGPALAHLRSPEGFLARRARGGPEMLRSLAHVGPALEELLALRHGRTPTETELAHALSLWNALADPREVLDQVAVLAWGPDEVAAALQRVLLAAL